VLADTAPSDRTDETSWLVRQLAEGRTVNNHRTVRRRKDGELVHLADLGELGDAELESVLAHVTAAVPGRREQFEATGELDLAYSKPELPRFRVNGFRQRGAQRHDALVALRFDAQLQLVRKRLIGHVDHDELERIARDRPRAVRCNEPIGLGERRGRIDEQQREKRFHGLFQSGAPA